MSLMNAAVATTSSTNFSAKFHRELKTKETHPHLTVDKLILNFFALTEPRKFHSIENIARTLKVPYKTVSCNLSNLYKEKRLGRKTRTEYGPGAAARFSGRGYLYTARWEDGNQRAPATRRGRKDEAASTASAASAATPANLAESVKLLEVRALRCSEILSRTLTAVSDALAQLEKVEQDIATELQNYEDETNNA